MTLRECPHDWKAVVAQLRGGDDSTFRAVGARTNIVEYHDCQRFIAPPGEYKQLVAIFAATTLTSPAPVVPATGDVAIASALIVNFDELYRPLGIENGFNCLYLYHGTSGYKARIKHFPGRDDPDCQPPSSIAELPDDTEFDVRESTVPPPGKGGPYDAGDVPPVARWDYDRAPGRPSYTAGLKCGAKWCEIGPRGFSPSSGRTADPAWPKNRRRVVEIRGWHDFQRLAVKVGAQTHPSDVGGYVTPDAALSELVSIDQFTKRWPRVATVELDGPPGVYETKLGFGPATATSNENQLFLCNGTWLDCLVASRASGAPAQGTTGSPKEPTCLEPGNPKDWWAVIKSPAGAVSYRCVHRRDHGTVEVPATARWRWVLDDESIWVRCANGCCQVDQGAT